MDEGGKIRKIREIRGYKQEYVAIQLNISIKAYSKLERGETKLTVERLCEIAKILEVEPEEIIHFSENQFFSSTHQASMPKLFSNNGTQEKSWYEQRIRYLEEEVSFLRKLLNKFGSASG